MLFSIPHFCHRAGKLLTLFLVFASPLIVGPMVAQVLLALSAGADYAITGKSWPGRDASGCVDLLIASADPGKQNLPRMNPVSDGARVAFAGISLLCLLTTNL